MRNIQELSSFIYRLKTLPVIFVRECIGIFINNSTNYSCFEKTLPCITCLGAHPHESITGLFPFFSNSLSNQTLILLVRTSDFHCPNKNSFAS